MTDTRGPYNRTPLDPDEVARAYLAGEDISALARRYRTSRGKMHRALVRSTLYQPRTFKKGYDVEGIRAARRAGDSFGVIADRFGVPEQAACLMCRDIVVKTVTRRRPFSKGRRRG